MELAVRDVFKLSEKLMALMIGLFTSTVKIGKKLKWSAENN